MSDDAPGMTIKLATWNLWWRFGDWVARGAAIKETLAALAPDIVGLQEVWFTEDENFAESLASDLGYHCAFVPSPAPQKWQRRIDDSSIGIGNAVLSRWPITPVSTARLPAGDAMDEGRVAILATVSTPSGTLPFAVTHLNSAWGHSPIRSEQLRTVVSMLASHPNADFPPVLCGDLNAMPDYDEVRSLLGKSSLLVPDLVLLDTWDFINHGRPGHTWDRRNPHVQATHEPSGIDFIFVGLATGAGRGKPVECGLFGNSAVNGVWPSDHFGVWTELLAETPASIQDFTVR